MKRITTLAALHRASMHKRSVVCPRLRVWANPTAAAFMMNLQGHYLMQLLQMGLFLYKPKKKKSAGLAAKIGGTLVEIRHRSKKEMTSNE